MTAGRRDQLASALVVAAASTGSYEAHDLADALLAPGGVVDRMIRQAQAEALDEVAHAWQWGAWANAPRQANRIAYGQYVTDWLRDRAAALRVTTDHPDVTQGAP